MSQSVNCSKDSIESKDFTKVFVTEMKHFEGMNETCAGYLTVWNVLVDCVADSCILVEQNDTAHNHANFLQRFHSVVRLEGSEILEVSVSHDGVQRIRDFSQHLKKETKT